MSKNDPIHLLSSLGVLASFTVGKRITQKEILEATKRIKRVYKEKDPEKFKKLLDDALIENTQTHLKNSMPPGFLFPQSKEKQKLDKYYLELTAVSHILANKFQEQKLTKLQVCFIINAIIYLLDIDGSDFEEFQKKFQKYKDNNYNEEEE